MPTCAEEEDEEQFNLYLNFFFEEKLYRGSSSGDTNRNSNNTHERNNSAAQQEYLFIFSFTTYHTLRRIFRLWRTKEIQRQIMIIWRAIVRFKPQKPTMQDVMTYICCKYSYKPVMKYSDLETIREENLEWRRREKQIMKCCKMKIAESANTTLDHIDPMKNPCDIYNTVPDDPTAPKCSDICYLFDSKRKASEDSDSGISMGSDMKSLTPTPPKRPKTQTPPKTSTPRKTPILPKTPTPPKSPTPRKTPILPKTPTPPSSQSSPASTSSSITAKIDFCTSFLPEGKYKDKYLHLPEKSKHFLDFTYATYIIIVANHPEWHRLEIRQVIRKAYYAVFKKNADNNIHELIKKLNKYLKSCKAFTAGQLQEIMRKRIERRDALRKLRKPAPKGWYLDYVKQAYHHLRDVKPKAKSDELFQHIRKYYFDKLSKAEPKPSVTNIMDDFKKIYK